FCRGQGGLSTLAAHAFPGRIINGFARNCRRATSTQDFYLDAAFRLREARGHVTERERLSNPMAIAARGDPAYWRAIMENGLVPDCVHAVLGDDERNDAPLRPLLALPACHVGTDEAALVERDETLEAGFKW